MSLREAYSRKRPDLRRSLRLSVADGLIATPIVTAALPGNVFMAALFTKALDLPKTSIGLIAALPFLSNIVQIFVTPFLGRWWRPQVLTVFSAGLNTLCWLILAVLLTWIPRDDPTEASRWLIGWYSISSLFSAVAGVSWNAWMQEWVPSRLRGKFFGHRNRLSQLSTLVFLLGVGWALGNWDYGIPVFQGTIVVAVLLRAISLYWLWISPTPSAQDTAVSPPPLSRQLTILRGAKPLLLFIMFGAVWSFAANCFGPFYSVFMLEELGLSALGVSICSTLAALGGALSLLAWGRLLDRFGHKSVMTVSLLLWQMQNFVWCVLSPANRDLVYPIWVWTGVTSAGFVLGQFTLLHKLVPADVRNLAIGVHLAITSAFAALAPIIGGKVLSWSLASWPDASLPIYQACFALQPTFSMLGVFLLLNLEEPRASSVSSVVGAMRNVRTLSGIFGLGFLAEYLFQRPAKRR